eukprot:Gregarina_sp_Poly_1__11046@NODE_885_length_5840_cov_171_699290_g513_i1_p3_GENE_NODE_885_length_5840_cov_171_699290_g513_i1NODE_885_length_5840_cov_171_699290_g513_i1_p3_ORF_typecomplete_len205_score8_24TPT/PF03151_16/1_6e18UAA/PF08449_11/0_068EamA/PF00892_20/1_4_NODE_885_length_5840_cov_171_699290_g513_i151545768
MLPPFPARIDSPPLFVSLPGRSKRRNLATATHKTAFSIRSRLKRHTIEYERFAEACLVISSLAAWYTASLILTACNKILLDSLSFPYPLIVTFVHFSGVALLIRMLLVAVGGTPLVALDFHTYILQILPIALCTAIEISLSNQAYSMVSLSVMTVIKSTLVAATYIVSIIAGMRCLLIRRVYCLSVSVGASQIAKVPVLSFMRN